MGKLNIKAFCRIDDRRAFASIALDYVVVFVTAGIASHAGGVPLTLLAIIVIAGRQSALQGLVHSACHFSLFSRKRDNETFQFLFAYPILDSVAVYRRQHLAHHRDFKLKSPDRFAYFEEHLELHRQGRWIRIWLIFVRPLLGHAGFVFVGDTLEALVEHPKHGARVALLWIVLIAGAWGCGFLWLFLLYWVVPLLWIYPVLDIWAEISDHLDAEGESRNQEGFFYSFLLKGHETYHAVHHMYPSVPFYRLRPLRDALRERGIMMESSRGPLHFLSIVHRPVANSARTPEAGLQCSESTS